jgi:hypothetical protein
MVVVTMMMMMTMTTRMHRTNTRDHVIGTHSSLASTEQIWQIHQHSVLKQSPIKITVQQTTITDV